MKKCLACYLPLNTDEVDFHRACSKILFGLPFAPIIPYGEKQVGELALEVIKSQVTVTGVQPKLSLKIAKGASIKDPGRFTIVGLWGGYILKPLSPDYPQLPEVEDVTMHLAAIAKIKVVPHSLIRMQSGNLAYITRRIDRSKEGKLAMEDMCQLTERMTENKYMGSYEQVAKAILKYSVNPGLDVINFFELVLFSFLTGNADMHLKNFSLINQPGIGYTLSPAYDLAATKLVNPADDEELALTLNGKRKKLRRSDFTAAFDTMKIQSKQQENIFNKMDKAKEKWIAFIKTSFLSDEFKEAYKDLLLEKFSAIATKD
ncbi:MAG: HipA domain-containing protein [Lentimicrobium sp.]|nr:HipA domain-containing protein [Lentimicrobium sp.]